MDPAKQDLLAIIEDLSTSARQLASTPTGDNAVADQLQRRKVLDAAYKVIDAVKTRDDEWMEASLFMALHGSARLFYEWKVFDLIPKHGWVPYGEVAVAVGVEEALLKRVGGVLVSSGVLAQDGQGKIGHTYRSLAWRREEMSSCTLDLLWQVSFVPYAKYPEYFDQFGRKEPQTVTHVPATFAHGKTEMGFYEMISHDPAKLNIFLKGMSHIENRMPISGIYDFSWLVAEAEKDPNSDRPLLVDVGGGKGQALKAIHAEFPGLPLRRCVLQDRLEVIEAGLALNEPELSAVQRMGIDFLQEQPVKGAYVYWIRRCLHNHGDDMSIVILQILASAMLEDSRLLIMDDVMEDPPNRLAAMLDFTMLGFGGKERTLEDWTRVLGAAGLRIASISRGEGEWKTLSVIECVRV